MPRHKLKFLIDIGVGKKVEQWLKDNGYDMKTGRGIIVACAGGLRVRSIDRVSAGKHRSRREKILTHVIRTYADND